MRSAPTPVISAGRGGCPRERDVPARGPACGAVPDGRIVRRSGAWNGCARVRVTRGLRCVRLTPTGGMHRVDRTPAFYRELLDVAGLMAGPSAIPAIYRVEDALREGKASAWMLRDLKRDPAVAAIIRDRHLRGTPPPRDRGPGRCGPRDEPAARAGGEPCVDGCLRAGRWAGAVSTGGVRRWGWGACVGRFRERAKAAGGAGVLVGPTTGGLGSVLPAGLAVAHALVPVGDVGAGLAAGCGDGPDVPGGVGASADAAEPGGAQNGVAPLGPAAGPGWGVMPGAMCTSVWRCG